MSNIMDPIVKHPIIVCDTSRCYNFSAMSIASVPRNIFLTCIAHSQVDPASQRTFSNLRRCGLVNFFYIILLVK